MYQHDAQGHYGYKTKFRFNRIFFLASDLEIKKLIDELSTESMNYHTLTSVIKHLIIRVKSLIELLKLVISISKQIGVTRYMK